MNITNALRKELELDSIRPDPQTLDPSQILGSDHNRKNVDKKVKIKTFDKKLRILIKTSEIKNFDRNLKNHREGSVVAAVPSHLAAPLLQCLTRMWKLSEPDSEGQTDLGSDPKRQ